MIFMEGFILISQSDIDKALQKDNANLCVSKIKEIQSVLAVEDKVLVSYKNWMNLQK